LVYGNLTDDRVIPQEAQPAWENSSSVLLKLFIIGNERCHTIDAL